MYVAWWILSRGKLKVAVSLLHKGFSLSRAKKLCEGGLRLIHELFATVHCKFMSIMKNLNQQKATKIRWKLRSQPHSLATLNVHMWMAAASNTRGWKQRAKAKQTTKKRESSKRKIKIIHKRELFFPPLSTFVISSPPQRAPLQPNSRDRLPSLQIMVNTTLSLVFWKASKHTSFSHPHFYVLYFFLCFVVIVEVLNC